MDIAINVNIGEKIRTVISDKGISQAQLGRMLETSPTYVTRLLKKETIDTDTLNELCEKLEYNFFEEFMPKFEIPQEHHDDYIESIEKPKLRRGFVLTHPHIGNCIVERLKEIKSTQAELGLYLGVTHQEISRLLKNESIDTGKLVKISIGLNWNFFGCFYSWNFDDDMMEANKADDIMSEYLGTERVYYSGIDSITGMFASANLDRFRYTIKNMFSLINILYKENKDLKDKLERMSQGHD